MLAVVDIYLAENGTERVWHACVVECIVLRFIEASALHDICLLLSTIPCPINEELQHCKIRELIFQTKIIIYYPFHVILTL